MARPSWNGRGYTADLKLFHCRKSKRVPKRFWGHLDGRERDKAAQGWCDEVERYCRLLESAAFRPSDVRHALDLGAIDRTTADALLGGELPDDIPAPTSRIAQSLPEEVTLERAAEEHPRTVTEKRKSGESYRRHHECLLDFIEWTKTGRDFENGRKLGSAELLRDCTLRHVLSWLHYLQHEAQPKPPMGRARRDRIKPEQIKRKKPARVGYSYDYCRHALYHIKRASVMAPTFGVLPFIPEKAQLLGDAKSAPLQNRHVPDLDELGRILRWGVDQGDHRLLVILATGAFMGMRPSEICDIQIKDIDFLGECTLLTGSKNAASRRVLPVPQIIHNWMTALIDDRDGEEHLLMTRAGTPRKDGSVPYRRRILDQEVTKFLKPLLQAAAGRSFPVKNCRKAWATWTRDDGFAEHISVRAMESFMGHKSTEVLPISADHYTQRVATKRLVPTAELVDRIIGWLLSGKDADTIAGFLGGLHLGKAS